jgi:hypothetical protein
VRDGHDPAGAVRFDQTFDPAPEEIEILGTSASASPMARTFAASALPILSIFAASPAPSNSSSFCVASALMIVDCLRPSAR